MVTSAIPEIVIQHTPHPYWPYQHKMMGLAWKVLGLAYYWSSVSSSFLLPRGSAAVVPDKVDRASSLSSSPFDDGKAMAAEAEGTARGKSAVRFSLSREHHSLLRSATGLLLESYREELDATIPSPLIDVHQVGEIELNTFK